jgi:RP/EB family microtubule-associated protein
MSGTNIGMMDKAYFVGRKEILAWLNDTFSLSVAKIEDTASGAVACQIMDAIYPGDVPMQKVKWDSKTEYEYIQNYKVLQRVFDRKKIDKHIDVEKLIRGKYQDNLEFMQWMKNFYHMNCTGGEYDPVERRSKGKGVDRTAMAQAGSGGGAASRAPASKRPPASGTRAAAAPGARRSAASSKQAGSTGRPGAGGSSAADAKRIADLKTEVGELRLSVEGLEKERDFYFGKLRDIEILLQAYGGEDKELVSQIFKILYATEEDFEAVDADEGEAEE